MRQLNRSSFELGQKRSRLTKMTASRLISPGGAPEARLTTRGRCDLMIWTVGFALHQVIRSLKTPSFWTGKVGCIIPGWEERQAMKASKISDAQKAFIIRQGEDGTPVEEVCRKAGISQATF